MSRRPTRLSVEGVTSKLTGLSIIGDDVSRAGNATFPASSEKQLGFEYTLAQTRSPQEGPMYPIQWLDETFSSRRKAEELLRPDLEAGLITQHDFDLATTFLPGWNRYWPVRNHPTCCRMLIRMLLCSWLRMFHWGIDCLRWRR